MDIISKSPLEDVTNKNLLNFNIDDKSRMKKETNYNV